MRRLWWSLAGLGALLPAQDAPSDARFEHATVILSSLRSEYYVHERIDLRLRVGVRESFLRANVVQPFRRELDVPVRVEADWGTQLVGTIALPDGSEPAGGRRLSFVLDGQLAEGSRVTDPERAGWVFVEIEKSFLAERAGELVIPGPTLRLAHATRFREDFLEGRVAEDQREAVVESEPLTLTIAPLPVAGRPPEFSGAVGRFSVSAEAEPRDLAVGQSVKLVLRIEGEGNLATLEMPRLPLPGFHVYGRIEDVGHGWRAVTYDIAPLHAGVTEVPAISFSFFDPAPPSGYHTVRTRPIALGVRGAGGEASVLPIPQIEPAGPEPGVTGLHDLMPVDFGVGHGSAADLSSSLLALVLLVPWLLAVGVLAWRRARAGGPGEAELRARGAAAVFRDRVALPGAEAAEALADYLATRLRSSAAAVIAPELPERLRAAGVPDELASRTAGLLDELVAARFGGDAPAGSIDAARALVDELEGAFSGAESER